MNQAWTFWWKSNIRVELKAFKSYWKNTFLLKHVFKNAFLQKVTRNGPEKKIKQNVSIWKFDKLHDIYYLRFFCNGISHGWHWNTSLQIRPRILMLKITCLLLVVRLRVPARAFTGFLLRSLDRHKWSAYLQNSSPSFLFYTWDRFETATSWIFSAECQTYTVPGWAMKTCIVSLVTEKFRLNREMWLVKILCLQESLLPAILLQKEPWE